MSALAFSFASEVDCSGDEPVRFCGYHHARVHEPDIVYHVVSRTFQGRWLLTPSPELTDITAGILGRAQTLFPSVKLFAFAFLMNHFHLMLQGTANEIPAFVGYLKRELSRRWGARAGWKNGLWSNTYQSTALPTPESQLNCFEYILSQGVKEGAVRAPEEWPGVHVARQLFRGEVLKGKWVDGSSLARAAFRASRAKTTRKVDRSRFAIDYVVRVDRLPVFADLAEHELRSELELIRARIIADHRGRKVIPIKRLARRRFDHATSLPSPPWWQARRRMICWASEHAPETRAYLQRYWMLQRTFRRASASWRGGGAATFPETVFRPGRFELVQPNE
jgi:hypothetical protein